MTMDVPKQMLSHIIRVVQPEEVERDFRRLQIRTLLYAPLFVGLFVLILRGVSNG